MEGRAIQGNKTIAIVLTGFGMPRESSIKINKPEAPVVPLPENGILFPHIPNVTPLCLQNFDLSLVIGDAPFTGSKNSHIGGWMRFKDGEFDEFTDTHLIALIDAWPVGVLPMLKAPAPMSTLSWNVQLIHPYEVAKDEWLLYNGAVHYTQAGYANAEAFVWNEAGHLIAISNQVVTIYESPSK
jgi:acyl-CoA thioesterase